MASQSSQNDPLSQFGTNEWLVDEMYQRFLKDPDSVDKAWLAFFRDYHPDSPPNSGNDRTADQPSGQTADRTADQSAGQPVRGGRVAPNSAPAGLPPTAPGLPPAGLRRSDGQRNGGPSADGRSTDSGATDARGTDGRPAAARTATPAAPARYCSTGFASPASASPASPSPAAPRPAAPRPAAPASRTGRPAAPRQTTGRAAPSVEAEAKPAAEPELVPLRGASARTAKNMDESLAVPTATSVRQVPVKLLIDNRIVINNHLARSRGGKVSFTHIIGYAIAKAVRSMPEMNHGYTEVDGKPTMVKPPHLSLGLAIDIQKPDGTRQLLVPNIKAAETLDFARFWSAYEDVVRRARGNKLTVDDFQGHLHQPDQPGHDRHQPLGPPPDGRAGLHRRRRRDGIPRRIPGRRRGDPQPARGEQDHDPHLDLRPPGHPGRAVG